MSLTIISGQFKGRLLHTPKGLLAKPTLALMRKSVFDICQGYLEGARFLDLFACSGAMGIEAISRGAAHATFIEKDRKTYKILLENIHLLKIEGQTNPLCADVFTAIKTLKTSSYDIVYIDPPYPLSKESKSPVLPLIHFLDTSHLLSDDCIVFIEEGAPGSLPLLEERFQRFHYKDHRTFGASLLHQLRTF